MSNATTHDDDAHEGFIKTPKQLVWVVVLSFVVPILLIVLLVNFVAVGSKPAAGTNALDAEAVAQRIQPVGRVTLRPAGGPTVARSGEEVFKAVCAACHATGAAGAPKVGDNATWAPRIGTGYDALLTSALKGKGAMGPQGGGEYSDFEIGRAVVYMTNQSGGKLAEPKAPAAAASAPAEAASN